MITVLGHRSHTEAVLQQSRAGDAWNYYQAKNIRRDNLNIVIDELSLQPSLNQAATAAKLAEYKTLVTKWTGDLEKQRKEAEEFEHEVDHAERQAGRYDLGEALLQISVVLCSITLFTRRHSWFVAGVSLGAVGVVVAASALLVH
jgi:urease accessory protein UreH